MTGPPGSRLPRSLAGIGGAFVIALLLTAAVPALGNVYGYVYGNNTAVVRSPQVALQTGNIGSSSISYSTAATATATAGLTYYESANPPLSGSCVSPCLTVDTSLSTPGTSGSVSMSASQVAYLWSTQYGGTSTAVPAGKMPVALWVSGTQTTNTPAIDGYCSSTGYQTSPVACSLTTTSSPDTIFVFVEVSCSYTTSCTSAPTVTGITATGLTFSVRTSTSGSTSVTSYVVEETANAATTLSAVSISVSLSSSTSSEVSMFAFGVSGALSSSQFDGSAVTNSGSGTAASATITTTNANDMVIGFVGAAMQSTAGAPSASVGATFSSIPPAGGVIESNKCRGQTYCYALADGEYHYYTSTQSGLSVQFTLSTSMNWFMIADAIKAGQSQLGAMSVSLYYTNSAGGGATLIGSGSTSTVTGTKTLYTVTVSASSFTIPASGYLEVQVSAPATTGSTYTLYWGSGQLTNFQTPAAYDYILAINNPTSASWNVNLAVASSSGVSRLSNMTIWLKTPDVSPYTVNSQQIALLSGSFTKSAGSAVTLAASTTMYVYLYVTATSTGSSTVILSLKVQPASAAPYAYYTIALTLA